jgi:dienelactone hydrolase
MGRGLDIWGTALAVCALVAPVAAAQAPDPTFHATAAQLYARSLQRGADQATNPDYLARVAPYAEKLAPGDLEDPERPQDVDPFRLDWAPTRGTERDVSIVNRYGARLHGHLSLPRGEGRHPVVLVLPGGSQGEYAYRGLQQGLAEAGYVVLGVSAQGDAGSQAKAPDPVPSTPANEYCRPGNFGGWQDPQEMDIVEPGACAGETPGPADQVKDLTDTAALVATHGEADGPLNEAYQLVKARKTFALLDALDWLLSDANPARDRVDGSRIGTMGHSFGSIGAVLAGNGDPERRVDAVVSLDGFGASAPSAQPTVPTLFEHAEEQDTGPFARPPTALLRGEREARQFRAAGVPTGVVVLGGSSHQEWNYIPAPLQQAPIAANASRDGERVGLHYALAWFDRWLGTGRTRKAATRRLTAARYDGRVDRSSIGQGPYNPATQRTVSPTIGGETSRYHLSPLYRSWIDLGRTACADLRAGCR